MTGHLSMSLQPRTTAIGSASLCQSVSTWGSHTMNRSRNAPLLRDLVEYGRKASLEQLCLPRTLDATVLDELEPNVAREIDLMPGQTLFRQHQPPQALYVVGRGALKTVLVDGGEADQITGFFFPGELVGLDALHEDRRACTAIAIDASSVKVLPLDHLQAAMRDAPALQQEIERLLVRALTEHEQLLAVVNQRPASERIAVFFFSLSCRLSANGSVAPEFSLPMNRSEIANYLGLAPETASRAIAGLRNLGILAGYGKHVHITDPTALRNLAVWGGT